MIRRRCRRRCGPGCRARRRSRCRARRWRGRRPWRRSRCRARRWRGCRPRSRSRCLFFCRPRSRRGVGRRARRRWRDSWLGGSRRFRLRGRNGRERNVGAGTRREGRRRLGDQPVRKLRWILDPLRKRRHRRPHAGTRGGGGPDQGLECSQNEEERAQTHQDPGCLTPPDTVLHRSIHRPSGLRNSEGGEPVPCGGQQLLCRPDRMGSNEAHDTVCQADDRNREERNGRSGNCRQEGVRDILDHRVPPPTRARNRIPARARDGSSESVEQVVRSGNTRHEPPARGRDSYRRLPRSRIGSPDRHAHG
jgi:hypothetical protein